jgi:PKD repeat protein
MFLFLLILLLVSQIRAVNSPKTINLKLEYKTNSIWDSDDDGIESEKAPIDFTVENTGFNWLVEEDKLCTKWEILSLDKNHLENACYGSKECCNFINLDPEKPAWNDVFYLQYNKYGATRNNKVTARVIYMDLNLDTKDIYSDILYSDLDYLYAVFLDDDYFKESVSETQTSDKEYLKTITSLEKIKSHNNISHILLTDNNNQKIDNLNKRKLQITFFHDATLAASVQGFEAQDVNWNNLEKISLETNDEMIATLLKHENISVKKSISLKKLNAAIPDDKYQGTVEFNTQGLVYNVVLHCDDYYKCSTINQCGSVNQSCYTKDGKMLRVYIPHFSSVVLALNNSQINLKIDSPVNTTYPNGEDLYLNFSTNLTLFALYLLDDGPYVPLGEDNHFSSKLNGTLSNKVIKNGKHNITIYLADNTSALVNYTHTFNINDSSPPLIDLSVGSMDLNNSNIESSTNTVTASITAQEYCAASYSLNGQENRNVELSEGKTASFNLNLVTGTNNLLINASDMHLNSAQRTFTFNYTKTASCSDGLQNGNETGIDCGGSCPKCIPFNISMEKTVFKITEPVRITIFSRPNSQVNLTVTLAGIRIYNEELESYSPDYPIWVEKTITGITQPGDYSVLGIMTYMNHSEAKTLSFHINDTNTNPLSVSIGANKTTIDEGETIGFTSQVSGNSDPVSYEWKFGNGDKSTEANPKYRYPHNGSFTVELKIKMNEWEKSAARTITVRKPLNVTIRVKNESANLVPDADVTLNGDTKNTSGSGLASFIVYRGEYNLRVSKDDYEDYSNSTDITYNQTIEIKLKRGTYDEDGPVIQLNSPENEARISSDAVNLVYRTFDSSQSDCIVYVSIDGSWWTEKATHKNIREGEERSLSLGNLENKKYQWKIECKDASGNSVISETRTFYVNTTANAPAPVAATEDDLSIDYLIQEIDDAVANLESLAPKEREAALAMGLQELLGKNKVQLQRAKRDLNNLVWRRLNDTELEEVRASILDQVQEIRDTTPKSLQIAESNEFITYPNKEDIKNISDTILNLDNKQYSKAEKKAFEDQNQKAQDLITVTTNQMIIEVDFISGKTGTITLIEKDIKTTGDLEGYSVIESIPKAIALNTTSLNALFDYSIIVEDPVIKIELPTQKYVYYVNKRVDMDSIKDTITVLVSDEPAKQNPVLGFAIFPDIRGLAQSSNIRLIIEILIIVILALVYVKFSGGFTKAKYIFNNRDAIKKVKEINKCVEQALTHLQMDAYDKAKAVYKDINHKFKELPKELKKEVYGKVTLLSSKLDVYHINKLIDKAIFSIENKQRETALKIYNQVSGIYKNIAPRFKSHVLERCKDLHKKLQGNN